MRLVPRRSPVTHHAEETTPTSRLGERHWYTDEFWYTATVTGTRTLVREHLLGHHGRLGLAVVHPDG